MWVAPQSGVIKESEAQGRKQTFLVVRYILITATGALAFLETAGNSSLVPLAALVITALGSNLVIGQASPFSFFDASFQAPVLVSDTAMISLCLLLTRASQESFLFFFFVLIMAAKLENLVTLAICAGLIGFASFLIAGDPGQGWMSPALMRIPFLFATAVFFGYVVLPERTGEMTPFNRIQPTGGRKTPAPRRTPRPVPVREAS